MSKSKSSSKNTSTTTQTTKTDNYDQRVAATDAGIALGPNFSGNLALQQIPPEVGVIVDKALNLASAAGQKAFENSDVNIEAERTRADNATRMLIIAVAGLAAIALVARL